MPIILICEGPSDNRLLRDLLPVFFEGACEWYSQDVYPFTGIETGTEFTAWKRIRSLFDERFDAGFRMGMLGRFEGEKIFPYARQARRALLLLKESNSKECGYILLCDEDLHDSERLKGFQQARESSNLKDCVAIGVADPKIEAWSLLGFSPESTHEEAALEEEKAKLSLDPTRDPVRLRSQTPNDLKDIKRVASVLFAQSVERESIANRNIGRITQYGGSTGVIEFLEECRVRIVQNYFGVHQGR